MKKKTGLMSLCCLLFIISCTVDPEINPIAADRIFFQGADLSSVNEMEDLGIVFKRNGKAIDPYEYLASIGFNLARIRLWHSPYWTDYSTLPDVIRSFQRAKEQGMTLLLDFHYSDQWSDPKNQQPPGAWENMDDVEMANALYDYTYRCLKELEKNNVLPQIVQIGNEVNPGILTMDKAILWDRQSMLFNHAIKAVRDIERERGVHIEIMLHIAGPENARDWLNSAIDSGIEDFDHIGLSYYHEWSNLTMESCADSIAELRKMFNRPVMIVETAYPWTKEPSIDSAYNQLKKGYPGYGISPLGQRRFWNDLVNLMYFSGGSGVVYWEPAWVSSSSESPWGVGSHWENATFFDFDANLHNIWED